MTERGVARFLVAVALVGALAGCGSVSAPSTPATEAAVTTSEPTPTEQLSPSPAADAVPEELAGTWRRNVDGEMVLLTLRDNGYRIQRGSQLGSGSVSVEGDEIMFSGSNLCDGIGRYTWEFVEERLDFTEIDEPCSGRAEVLPLGTFGRVDE